MKKNPDKVRSVFEFPPKVSLNHDFPVIQTLNRLFYLALNFALKGIVSFAMKTVPDLDKFLMT